MEQFVSSALTNMTQYSSSTHYTYYIKCLKTYYKRLWESAHAYACVCFNPARCMPEELLLLAACIYACMCAWCMRVCDLFNLNRISVFHFLHLLLLHIWHIFLGAFLCKSTLSVTCCMVWWELHNSLSCSNKQVTAGESCNLKSMQKTVFTHTKSQTRNDDACHRPVFIIFYWRVHFLCSIQPVLVYLLGQVDENIIF